MTLPIPADKKVGLLSQLQQYNPKASEPLLSAQSWKPTVRTLHLLVKMMWHYGHRCILKCVWPVVIATGLWVWEEVSSQEQNMENRKNHSQGCLCETWTYAQGQRAT